MSEPEPALPPAPGEAAVEVGALAIPDEPEATDASARQGLHRLNTARGMRRHLRAIRMVLNVLLLLALLYTITDRKSVV